MLAIIRLKLLKTDTHIYGLLTAILSLLFYTLFNNAIAATLDRMDNEGVISKSTCVLTYNDRFFLVQYTLKGRFILHEILESKFDNLIKSISPKDCASLSSNDQFNPPMLVGKNNIMVAGFADGQIEVYRLSLEGKQPELKELFSDKLRGTKNVHACTPACTQDPYEFSKAPIIKSVGITDRGDIIAVANQNAVFFFQDKNHSYQLLQPLTPGDKNVSAINFFNHNNKLHLAIGQEGNILIYKYLEYDDTSVHWDFITLLQCGNYLSSDDVSCLPICLQD